METKVSHLENIWSTLIGMVLLVKLQIDKGSSEMSGMVLAIFHFNMVAIFYMLSKNSWMQTKAIGSSRLLPDLKKKQFSSNT